MDHEGLLLFSLKCFYNKLNATNENIRFMLTRSTCTLLVVHMLVKHNHANISWYLNYNVLSTLFLLNLQWLINNLEHLRGKQGILNTIPAGVWGFSKILIALPSLMNELIYRYIDIQHSKSLYYYSLDYCIWLYMYRIIYHGTWAIAVVTFDVPWEIYVHITCL